LGFIKFFKGISVNTPPFIIRNQMFVIRNQLFMDIISSKTNKNRYLLGMNQTVCGHFPVQLRDPSGHFPVSFIGFAG